MSFHRWFPCQRQCCKRYTRPCCTGWCRDCRNGIHYRKGIPAWKRNAQEQRSTCGITRNNWKPRQLRDYIKINLPFNIKKRTFYNFYSYLCDIFVVIDNYWHTICASTLVEIANLIVVYTRGMEQSTSGLLHASCIYRCLAIPTSEALKAVRFLCIILTY